MKSLHLKSLNIMNFITYDVLHPGTVNVLNPTEIIKNITAKVVLHPIYPRKNIQYTECTVGKIYTPIFSFFSIFVVNIAFLELTPLSNERSVDFTFYIFEKIIIFKFYTIVAISQKILNLYPGTYLPKLQLLQALKDLMPY